MLGNVSIRVPAALQLGCLPSLSRVESVESAVARGDTFFSAQNRRQKKHEDAGSHRPKPPHNLKTTMSTPASARPSRKARSSTPKYVVDSDEDDIGSDSPIEIDDGDDSSVEPKPSTSSSKRAPRRSAASAKKASYKDADSDDDDDGESSFHSSSASDVMSVDSSFSDDDFGGTTSSAKKKKKKMAAPAKAKKAPAAKAAKTPAGKKKAASGGSAAARTKKSPAAATPTSSASVVATPASKKKAAASTGSAAKSKAAKAKTVTPPNTLHESIDVVLPQSILSLGSSGGSAPSDCTVLVQIDPKDAMSTLDFHGASGAIGRFEADHEGITMDFKGFQYQGIIHPGPTAMIASINAKSGQMKVESITDEFVTLEKTHDVMARLDAQVEGDLDEGYSTKGHDANVNYSGARGGGNASEMANDGSGKKSGGGKKRAGSSGAKNAGGTSAKKRTVAPKK